jgi:hypothetical protein
MVRHGHPARLSQFARNRGRFRRTLTGDPQSASVDAPPIINLVSSPSGSACLRLALSENERFRPRRPHVLSRLPPSNLTDERVAVASRSVRLAPALLACGLLAAGAWYAVPRGYEAQHLLAIEDDPAQIADRALDHKFNAAVAKREIDDALAAEDADLAQSFVDLSKARGITLEPKQTARVDAAVAKANSTQQAMESFAQGFVTGEPKDVSGMAGTVTGDLRLFGDILDAVREGGRWIS